jgi:hypothetical protein
MNVYRTARLFTYPFGGRAQLSKTVLFIAEDRAPVRAAGPYCMLNNKISIATRSVTPPLKSVKATKMYSVEVIAPSPVTLARAQQ